MARTTMVRTCRMDIEGVGSTTHQGGRCGDSPFMRSMNFRPREGAVNAQLLRKDW
jgi:hypothetical protein